MPGGRACMLFRKNTPKILSPKIHGGCFHPDHVCCFCHRLDGYLAKACGYCSRERFNAAFRREMEKIPSAYTVRNIVCEELILPTGRDL